MTDDIIRIPNIDTYFMEIVNGELVLTPRNNYITEDEFQQTDFTFSRIMEYTVRTREQVISSTKRKYRSILREIWSYMPKSRLLRTTTYKMDDIRRDGYKYKWDYKLNLYVQDKDANGAVRELFHMVRVNHYSLHIIIQLQTERVIKFKYNL